MTKSKVEAEAIKDPRSKALYVRIPKVTGIPIPGTECVGRPGLVVHEGDLILYSYESDGSRPDIARVLGLAVRNGCGKKLDPYLFAVLTMTHDGVCCFQRFVHPDDIQSVWKADALNLPRWFFASAQFTYANLQLLYRMAEYGSLSVRSIQVIEENGIPKADPHSQMNYVSSRILKVPNPDVDEAGEQDEIPVIINAVQARYENWLLESYRCVEVEEAPASHDAGGKLLATFFRETKLTNGERHEVRRHGRRIGGMIYVG